MRVADDLFEPAAERDPELPLYRDRTVRMLQKYLRMSTVLGHLPALIGREFFRAHVSHYRTHTFEDTYIFVHDMERCLERLSQRNQMVIAMLFFQQYTNEETAVRVGQGHATVGRWRLEALDALTAILLERKLLRRLVLLPSEDLDLEEDNVAIVSEDNGPGLPPRKRVGSVKVLHAVSFSA